MFPRGGWRVTPSFEEAAPPASDEQIAATERELGVTFPAAYRAFLAKHNGGYLDPAHFEHQVLVERLFSAGPTPVEGLEDLVSVHRTYFASGSDHVSRITGIPHLRSGRFPRL